MDSLHPKMSWGIEDLVNKAVHFCLLFVKPTRIIVRQCLTNVYKRNIKKHPTSAYKPFEISFGYDSPIDSFRAIVGNFSPKGKKSACLTMFDSRKTNGVPSRNATSKGLQHDRALARQNAPHKAIDGY